MYDLIIIGGGPAGITAGIYSARKKLKALVLTKDFFAQPAKTAQIDNWPGSYGISGMELMKKFKEHLLRFDIEIKDGEDVKSVEKDGGFFLVKTNKEKFESRAVILAVGAVPCKLGVQGEQEFLGRGVSFCSVCDAPFFKDKQVAVAGGGNAGFEAALDLAKYASKIFILESRATPTADELLQEMALKTGRVEVIANVFLKSINGSKTVEKIIFESRGLEKELKVGGVFIEIGWKPNTEFLSGLVNLNDKGEVIVNPATCQTSCSGIFAAGDAADASGFKQIVIAAGQGAKAALSAYDYLKY